MLDGSYLCHVKSYNCASCLFVYHIQHDKLGWNNVTKYYYNGTFGSSWIILWLVNMMTPAMIICHHDVYPYIIHLKQCGPCKPKSSTSYTCGQHQLLRRYHKFPITKNGLYYARCFDITKHGVLWSQRMFKTLMCVSMP